MLKEKLSEDIKNALKSGDKQRRMVLSLVISAIKNKEIEKHGELTDEEVVAVISSEIKKRRDSVAQFEKGGRPELAESEKQEIDILMAYMPEQMPEEQIREEVKKAIAETGAKDVKEMGKVLGVLMPKLKGRADGSLVSRMVKEELSG
ncbi:MAG: GatB/YqeY domain-containing protein [Candidatus Yanofskybacteria bacterium]|nr:GatB/YqeY domain-containing protein [Candidatus Yanofskybacteria bacterium]